MKQIKTICICGAGTMGSGIAQVAAQSGFQTIQFDLNPEMLEKSKKSIASNLTRLAEKGKITEAEQESIFNRIHFTSELKDCVADMVIEAIVERKEIKIDLFTKLATINAADTILATNTSSIPVSAIAADTPNAERVVGMHFFNPAPLMKLVEVIKGDLTSVEVMEQTVLVAKQMEKIPVQCKDAPGFIVNRVARHFYLEAMRFVEKGQTDIDTIDAVMEAQKDLVEIVHTLKQIICVKGEEGSDKRNNKKK